MKRNSFISTSLLLICFIVAFSSVNQSVEAKNNSKLIGTWTQCDKDGKILVFQNKVGEYKIITDNQFLVYQTDMTNAIMIFSGSYSIDKDIYSEKILISNPNSIGQIGLTNKFKFKLKDGILTIEGLNNNYNQFWKKVNPFENKEEGMVIE
jgi:hypothetical protein